MAQSLEAYFEKVCAITSQDLPDIGELTSIGSLAKVANLGHELWESVDPKPDIKKLFKMFDQIFFGGSLKGVRVQWSNRMTRTAGVTYLYTSGSIMIRLSAPIHKDGGRKDLIETLLHEMIHAHIFKLGGKGGHGKEFVEKMEQINEQTGLNITILHYFLVDAHPVQKSKAKGRSKRPKSVSPIRISSREMSGMHFLALPLASDARSLSDSDIQQAPQSTRIFDEEHVSLLIDEVAEEYGFDAREITIISAGIMEISIPDRRFANYDRERGEFIACSFHPEIDEDDTEDRYYCLAGCEPIMLGAIPAHLKQCFGVLEYEEIPNEDMIPFHKIVRKI